MEEEDRGGAAASSCPSPLRGEGTGGGAPPPPRDCGNRARELRVAAVRSPLRGGGEVGASARRVRPPRYRDPRPRYAPARRRPERGFAEGWRRRIEEERRPHPVLLRCAEKGPGRGLLPRRVIAGIGQGNCGSLPSDHLSAEAERSARLRAG